MIGNFGFSPIFYNFCIWRTAMKKVRCRPIVKDYHLTKFGGDWSRITGARVVTDRQTNKRTIGQSPITCRNKKWPCDLGLWPGHITQLMLDGKLAVVYCECNLKWIRPFVGGLWPKNGFSFFRDLDLALGSRSRRRW